ncbi:hypothetical protein SASPL_103443 [Salvia splendens]|uniref:CHY-type domain-containing protein n=1 Tax=Salvia splendens TaxID=180675 RepID=A0A8X8YFT7_SALSN|nr:hypothetical protein SASPL_103443 [Salvia splendens]
METLGANSAAAQTQNRDDSDVPREYFGALQHGCDHYRRRCKLKAPCCDQIFTCRHCHNEATSTLSNPRDRHAIVRHEVKQVQATSLYMSLLFVQYAILNNRFPIYVRIVASNLVNTSAAYANSMMMISVKTSFIAMTVAFAELVVAKTSFIAPSVCNFMALSEALKDEIFL